MYRYSASSLWSLHCLEVTRYCINERFFKDFKILSVLETMSESASEVGYFSIRRSYPRDLADDMLNIISVIRCLYSFESRMYVNNRIVDIPFRFASEFLR